MYHRDSSAEGVVIDMLTTTKKIESEKANEISVINFLRISEVPNILVELVAKNIFIITLNFTHKPVFL